MAASVAAVYGSLSAQDRAQAVIIAPNYGIASALDFYGTACGLPKAVCTHNNYYLWGPGNRSGETAIAVGIPLHDLVRIYKSTEKADAVSVPYTRDLNPADIFIARGPNGSFRDLFKGLKHFD